MSSKAEPIHSSIEDMREYVDAFRTSSNRSRSMLYIVLIATTFIWITNWNAREDNWPLSRIGAWYGAQFTPSSQDSAKLLEEARQEYLRQFIGHTVLTSSPIPGVAMDVNDLGVMGGMALVLLMGVLLVCIHREHENLYLALYKVRVLCIQEGEAHKRGNSRANLLYHALAMSQVIGSPPTLARWRGRGALNYLLVVMFFIPSAVYVWVFLTDWTTQDVVASYHVNARNYLIFEGLASIALLLLSTFSCVYSRAIALRWKRAFYRVNPARRRLDQMRWWDWTKLSSPPWSSTSREEPRYDKEGHRPRLVAALVDSLDVRELGLRSNVRVEKQCTINGSVDGRTMQQVADAIYEKGEKRAKAWCADHGAGFQKLVRFRTTRNKVRGSDWYIEGVWTFMYHPAKPADTPDGDPSVQR